MKTLLCLLAILFCSTRSNAITKYSFPFYLDGDLTWNITQPQCGFKLKGELQNVSATGTGFVRLVLWASKFEYPPTVPNQANAVIVGEYLLGSLGAGFQFDDFTVKTRSELPTLNGTYNFTIAVVEYVGGVNYNRFLISGGAYELVNGEFVGQEKWPLPNKTVIDPLDGLLGGDIFDLTEKATGENNRFPTSWQKKTKLTLQSLSKISYQNDNRKETVKYKYSVSKALYNGVAKPCGKLMMTYSQNSKVTYTETVYLFFQGRTGGSYRSVVKGFLFGDEIGKSNTQGSFKLK